MLSADIPCMLEPPSLSRYDEKQPGGITTKVEKKNGSFYGIKHFQRNCSNTASAAASTESLNQTK